jgi:hypothetical protein
VKLYCHYGEKADNELKNQTLMLRKSVTSKQEVCQTPGNGKYQEYKKIGISLMPRTATQGYDK